MQLPPELVRHRRVIDSMVLGHFSHGVHPELLKLPRAHAWLVHRSHEFKHLEYFSDALAHGRAAERMAAQRRHGAPRRGNGESRRRRRDGQLRRPGRPMQRLVLRPKHSSTPASPPILPAARREGEHRGGCRPLPILRPHPGSNTAPTPRPGGRRLWPNPSSGSGLGVRIQRG